MTKNELVDFVYKQTDGAVYKKDLKHIIDTVFKGIQHGLIVDGKVTVVDFGSFVLRDRAPRIARNPKTGDRVRVPSKTVPVFRASDNLKDQVS